ncbi:MAG: hypothetical protein R3185_04420 [Candidatus Thermoplasmatota archaeon]|nr:hypothetical protein [Candidatus Thermoplasmatota archaeon]
MLGSYNRTILTLCLGLMMMTLAVPATAAPVAVQAGSCADIGPSADPQREALLVGGPYTSEATVTELERFTPAPTLAGDNFDAAITDVGCDTLDLEYCVDIVPGITDAAQPDISVRFWDGGGILIGEDEDPESCWKGAPDGTRYFAFFATECVPGSYLLGSTSCAQFDVSLRT